MSKLKKLKIPMILLASLAFLAAIVAVWAYTGKPNSLKNKIIGFAHLPIAMVGNKFIYLDDFKFRYALAEKLNAGNRQKDSRELAQDVADSMIKDAKTAALASKYGIMAGDKELDNEFALIADKTGTADRQDIHQVLDSYGLSRQTFKNFILKPQTISVKLNTWYNSQSDLNKNAYGQAAVLQNNLKNNADFAELAKAYSQDPSSQSMEGDMGYMKVSELLPEIAEPVDSMQIGQIKLVASRYGLHIVQLTDKNSNGLLHEEQVHLRQIFLKTGDFNGWVDEETKNIKVKIFYSPQN